MRSKVGSEYNWFKMCLNVLLHSMKEYLLIQLLKTYNKLNKEALTKVKSYYVPSDTDSFSVDHNSTLRYRCFIQICFSSSEIVIIFQQSPYNDRVNRYVCFLPSIKLT